MADYDVIVVGAGNAACAAAVSAREQGAARVLLLEKASEEMRGGNTHYSGGLLRIFFDRTEDLLAVIPDVEKQAPGFVKGVPPYPKDEFWADLLRVTNGRTDAELAEILIGRSQDTIRWMSGKGIRMEASVSLTAIKIGNEIKWPTGAVVRAIHEGVGLSKMWFDIAAENGVEILYATRAGSFVAGQVGPGQRGRRRMDPTACARSAPARSCSAAAASSRTRHGGPAISADRGITPRSAVRPSTPVTG